MTRWKSLLLGAVQLAIVLSLGAKMLHDRSRLPRAWARVVPYDPELLFRGRYVSLALVVEMDPIDWGAELPKDSFPARLEARGERIFGVPLGGRKGFIVTRQSATSMTYRLRDPIAFYIPEKATDPSRLPAGQELWVEVSLPREGPPRPIRLGVKREGHINALP